MRKGREAALAAAVTGLLSVSAGAVPFTAGNLVIDRIGTGTGSMTSAATATFIDEYTPAGVFVQSIAMPTAASGSQRALTSSGTASSEGMITTYNGYVAVTGYDSAAGTTGVVASSAARTVAIVDVNGDVDTSTALTDAYTANNIRGAVTDGTNIWTSGTGTPNALGGVRYTTVGSTTSTQLSSTVTNIRAVNIFGGQLYSSDSSGSAVRVGTVGTGLPMTTGQTITNLPGTPVNTSPYQFVLLDLDGTVAGVDTLYVADDSANTIAKYSLLGGSWTANGTITATAVRGLTAIVTGTTVDLFGTTGSSTATGAGTLYSAIDTAGYNAAPSVAAATSITTVSGEAFRGIALVPTAVPEPASLGMIALAGSALLGRRRKSK